MKSHGYQPKDIGTTGPNNPPYSGNKMTPAERMREAAAQVAFNRWAARREHADRLAEMDYPESNIDAKTVGAKADEAEMIEAEIRALPIPPEPAVRVKPLVWTDFAGIEMVKNEFANDDNLAIALCSYFESRIDCPEGDENGAELDDNGCWKVWASENAETVMMAISNKANETIDARIEALEAELAVSRERAGLVDYVLQDNLHNRLTPRVVDIAYSAFMLGRGGKNKDDGGPCDWFNDTKPMVDRKIAEIRAALAKHEGKA